MVTALDQVVDDQGFRVTESKFDPLVSARALTRRFAVVEGPEVLTATVLDGALVSGKVLLSRAFASRWGRLDSNQRPTDYESVRAHIR